MGGMIPMFAPGFPKENITRMTSTQKRTFNEQYYLVCNYFEEMCAKDAEGYDLPFKTALKFFLKMNYDPDTFSIQPDLFNVYDCNIHSFVQTIAYARSQLIDYSLNPSSLTREQWLSKRQELLKKEYHEYNPILPENGGGMRYKLEKYIN